MLFNELRLHGKLAAKRHPMYEKNKIGKYIMYASFIFWGAYFIFIGNFCADGFCQTDANKYKVSTPENKGGIHDVFADFILFVHRMPFGSKFAVSTQFVE